MSLVIDSSAVIEMLRVTAKGSVVAGHVRGEHLVTPELMDLEVVSAFRRFRRQGMVTESRARMAMADLERLKVRRLSHAGTLRGIWELVSRLTAYDAAYVALARRLDCPLITCDRRLAGAGSLGVPVIVV